MAAVPINHVTSNQHFADFVALHNLRQLFDEPVVAVRYMQVCDN
jgi:hypothetical protein